MGPCFSFVARGGPQPEPLQLTTSQHCSPPLEQHGDSTERERHFLLFLLLLLWLRTGRSVSLLWKPLLHSAVTTLLPLSAALPDVVPAVSPSMTDTKKQVKVSAKKAMGSACDVIGNIDIEHMTVHILRSITNPEDVPEIMHELAGVTFAQSVESPALAMVVPLFLRGLNTRVTATKRQAGP